ncbi:glycosyltransferase family 2 protein [Alicyclobacillus sp. TC]|uniref:Glycosyltransferase, GT2 family n=1 Tax=Alicyclobacillus tolerans TaxID=90970 RepID=A0A1M6SRV3_9BACL|nr:MULTISPECIES: glycosyltransferase family 2 protein [Alicyclobacillus]QRF22903.1 glycosyltransferase family 2 protein [Alicyclobacillus sp. TC]SHK47425.1 Glycosyltransferase, GT2 family [Alicyclobacillus montanus]
MESDRLAIIVISYNTREKTKRCIEHLLRNTDLPFLLWIVDNGSTDGSLEMLRVFQQRYEKKITLLENRLNLGYAGAMTRVYRQIPEDYHVAYVNSDAYVGPGWASRLCRHFYRDERVGAVGPLGAILGGQHDFLHRFGSIPVDLAQPWSSAHEVFLTKVNQQLSSQEVVAETSKLLIGAVMMVNAYAHQQLGGLDPLYTFGVDDFDYSLRLRIASWKLLIALDTFVFHDNRSTVQLVGQGNHFTETAWNYFNRKWSGWFSDLNWDDLFLNRASTVWPPFEYKEYLSVN